MILCVSNDQLLLKTRRSLLLQAGYAVMTQSGRDAILCVELLQWQLVILCHSLTPLERSRLMDKLQRRPDTPYILLNRQMGEMEIRPALRVRPGSYSPAALLRCIADLLHAAEDSNYRRFN